MNNLLFMFFLIILISEIVFGIIACLVVSLDFIDSKKKFSLDICCNPYKDTYSKLNEKVNKLGVLIAMILYFIFTLPFFITIFTITLTIIIISKIIEIIVSSYLILFKKE